MSLLMFHKNSTVLILLSENGNIPLHFNAKWLCNEIYLLLFSQLIPHRINLLHSVVVNLRHIFI